MLTSKNPKINFFGFPDSGYFFDYVNLATNDNDYTQKMKVLYDYVNKDTNTPFPNQACV
jgi:hypothetical protein